MSVKRNPLKYLVLVISVMLLGLSSRRYSMYLPKWLNLYLGDALWALMIFFIVAFLFRKSKTRSIALGACVFSFSIEISQLYHAGWIDLLRNTTLGGLILGYGFLWSDLISYAVGIGVGVLLEGYVFKT